MSVPITVHKSLFGVFVIYLVGFLVTIVLLAGLAFQLVQNHNPSSSNTLVLIYMGSIVLTLIVTFVQAWVYSLSKMIITDDALTVTTWATLFVSNNVVTEFRHINDVDVKKGGIFSQLFDFGTVLVSTASSERNLQIPTIGQVEHWRDVLQAKADAAVTPVKEVT